MGHNNIGHQIVTRAAGRWAREMPAYRLRFLRDTIEGFEGVVQAFDVAHDLPEERQRHIILNVVAYVARDLMLEAADGFRSVLALSPQLRELIAAVDARLARISRVAANVDKGGAQ
jgi:hypothetical protein